MDNLRINCPMRHENGNCLPCGGFCLAVSNEICRGLRNAYRNGAGSVLKWIPVSERLPEQYSSAIGWTEYREIGEVYYDGKKFEWVTDEDTAFVTHWMPIPEPPTH